MVWKAGVSKQRAICYIRVSTQEQATEGVSMEAQEERLLAYCQFAGLEVVKVIREAGVSASKPLAKRPGGAELISMLKEGEANNVVALKLDRLFRNTEDALHVTSEWDKSGIALHLVDMGGQAINTQTAMGRFFITVLAGFAEFERALISERTATALRHKKINRQAYTSTPYGFHRDGIRLVEAPEEQQVISKIFDMRRAGYSYREIAKKLNDAGIPTKMGKKWAPGTVHYIVNNSLYKEVS